MKKIWIFGLILFLIILPVAYYLISPLWKVVELQDKSPLSKLQVNDRMDLMTDSEKEQFEREVREASNSIVIMSDNMPGAARVLTQGIFKARAHNVAGTALLIDDGNTKILRFENFETINGPNLHIYLASSLGEEDFIDLGEIKATKGNVNYDISAEIDIKKYNKVLVWCVPFKVLFSYAELN